MKFHLPYLYSLLAFVLLCDGCRKKESLQVDSESQSIVDNCLADQEFMCLPALLYNGLSRVTSAGASENPTRNCGPFLFREGDTLDFVPRPLYRYNMSQSSCVLSDGKERSGELTVRLSSYLNVPGTRSTISLNNYRSAGWEYNCDSIVLITKGNSKHYSGYRMIVYNGSCTNENDVIYFNCDREVAVYPDKTAPSGIAVTSFFGYSSGVNRVKLAFETEVVNDVYKLNDCRYFTSGTLKIAPEGFKQRYVDFGVGECEDLGTFTVNENTVAFKLK